MDSGAGVSPGQITVSIGIRELPEFVCLMADLQRMQAEMESGTLMASDAAEMLQVIINGWVGDQMGD